MQITLKKNIVIVLTSHSKLVYLIKLSSFN